MSKQMTLHGYPVNIGDRVWHILHGWMEVTQVDKHQALAVAGGWHIWFWDNGTSASKDINPSIFWQPIELPPPPSKPGHEIDWDRVPRWTKVQVRDTEEDPWIDRWFLMKGVYDYLCMDGNKKVYRYRYCRIHPDVEIKPEWLK